MVRITTWLCRVPMIKFKKGGLSRPAAGPAAAPAAAPSGGPAAAMQPAAKPMSTGASIPDIDLPARYRRQPLSEEEIAHINGGGVESSLETKPDKANKILGVLRVPKGVLVSGPQGKQEAVTLNIVLQKYKAGTMKKC